MSPDIIVVFVGAQLAAPAGPSKLGPSQLPQASEMLVKFNLEGGAAWLRV